MVEIYWGCVIGGILFAVVTVVFGDVLDGVFDGIFEFLSIESPNFLQPMVIVGAITMFGGAGILLNEYTFFSPVNVAILSIFIAIILSFPVYFFYVRPMQHAETSNSFSIQDLVGKIGEVTIPVPAQGYGEVIIKIGASFTNQIAASFDKVDIPSDARVVVIKSEEGVLFVSHFESDLE